MTTKTPLQQSIKNAILANPNRDDEEIARIVYSENHPGEQYKRSNPTPQYVSKIRGRVALESQAPEVEVSPEEVPEAFTPEELEEAEKLEETTEPFKLPAEETPTKTEEPSLFEGEEIVRVGFDGIAAFTSWEGWKLDTKNATDRKFMESSARMIEKHAPGAVAQYGDELMFIVSAASAVGPRIRDYKKHLDSEKPKIPPSKTPSPQATEETKATETTDTKSPETPTTLIEEPRSIGDEAFKRRLGGKL